MEQIILFTFLALFPFGQIIRVGIIQPLDIIVGVGAVYAIVKKLPRPKVYFYLQNFLLVAAFSWLFGAASFGEFGVFRGFLYLIRLAAYFHFFILVWNFSKRKISYSNLLLKSLLSLSLISALFGWIQYFFFPSFKSFMIWGWDEHLYRIAGTFLDPSYLSIILVFGIIIAFFKKKYGYLFFLLLTLAFTYSRAGYLAFFAALIPMWIYSAKTRVISILALLMLSFIIFLPRAGGEGVKLERISSVSARMRNYRETFGIFKISPVFGVGYNNICLAKNGNFSSHSCSGSDSSLLLILATTGIVGFLYFVFMALNIWKSADAVFRALAVALLIHSSFSNSIFYSWVLGFLLILLATNLKRKVEG